MDRRGKALVGVALTVILAACETGTGPEEHRYVALVTGGVQSCARSDTGSWYCWGRADVSRAGVPASPDEIAAIDWSRPHVLPASNALHGLSAGEMSICGLAPDGEARCWGKNEYGGLGLGVLGGEYLVPTGVQADVRFELLASSSTALHACGLMLGKAYCWGNNFQKQLGAGIEVFEYPFVTPVLGDRVFTQLATGSEVSCGLTASTDLYCWGDVEGFEELLGEPTLIAEATGFDTIQVSEVIMCALRSGEALCRGTNTLGELGTGDTEPHEGFVPVAGGLSFRQLAAGRVHFCGVTFEEEAYCWGAGRFGRLGDGSEERALVPVRVVGNQR